MAFILLPFMLAVSGGWGAYTMLLSLFLLMLGVSWGNRNNGGLQTVALNLFPFVTAVLGGIANNGAHQHLQSQRVLAVPLLFGGQG